MRANPLDERFARDSARRDTENHRLGVIDVRAQLRSIQHEKDFKRRVTDPLVAVDERMIEKHEESERCGFFFEALIQLNAIECRPRLRDGRFERAQVANGKRATANGDDASLQFQDCAIVRKHVISARHRRGGDRARHSSPRHAALRPQTRPVGALSRVCSI